MIPIKDENPTQRIPYVTVTLMALNVLVYVYQLILPAEGEFILLHQYGLVPAWLTGLSDVQLPGDWLPRVTTLISYAFVHGGFMHLAGNMLYLWIFGNNIEDVLGPVRFLAFYLLGGVLAALAQVATGPGSTLPMVGASGAIASVLGAYLILFPRANVVVLIWFFFFVRLIRVPAILMLGLWFLIQVLGAGGPGVAWMAHIGGFVAGLLLIRFFLPRPRTLH
ncbi:MAG: rhomboid family intramembrane serine protease [Desulfarculaceae bacterium]